MNALISQMLHAALLARVSAGLQEINAKLDKSGLNPLERQAIALGEAMLLQEAQKLGFDLTPPAAATTQ